EYDMHTEFIELAGKVNSQMPAFCVAKVARALNSRRKALNGSRVLVIGVAYKADVNDTRESPALRVIDLLRAEGAMVEYHDPHVAALPKLGLESRPLDADALAAPDVVVVVTPSFVKASSGRTILTSSSALSTTIDRVPDPAPPPEQPANKASATRARVKITRVRGRAIGIKRRDRLAVTGHRATDPHRRPTPPDIVMVHLA
ncbi:MAG: UDP binding domain-containing protein, partial [Acidimicrobiales bacterium]